MNEQKKIISSNLPVISRSFLRTQLKIGDTLIAKNECIMTDGKKTLSVGKQYPIINFRITDFYIIDDNGTEHYFVWRKDDEAYWQKFFRKQAQRVVDTIKASNGITRSFRLTPSEKKLFNESKSQEIRFSIGGGIGIGVSYLNDKGIWIDITDYDARRKFWVTDKYKYQ